MGIRILKTFQLILSRTPLLVRSVLAYVVLAVIITLIGVIFHEDSEAVSIVPYQRESVEVLPENAGGIRRVVEGMPNRIVIESLNIDLPVNPGKYDATTGEWTLSNSAAYFATVTDQPNDFQSNTFIYGHNRRSVFGPLANLRTGDTVRIFTTNGHVFIYTFTGDDNVDPTMTDVLYEHPSYPRLVLMTCEGLTSTTRRIMYFALTGVDS